MTYRDLALLAFLVGRESPQLLFGGTPSVELQIEYWLAGKTRNDQWMRLLKALEQDLHSWPDPPGDLPAITLAEALIAEILTSELLSRVWAAISCGWDQLAHHPRLEPLAHSVLMGHLQASARARQLQSQMSQSPPVAKVGFELADAVAGWSDQIIGWISSWVPVTQYAAEPDRAAEFAREWREQGADNSLVWKLLRNLMTHRLSALPEGPPTTREINRRLGSVILGTIPRSIVGDPEFATSFWPYWVDRFVDRTQELVDRAVGD